jgi:hypothetical protein
LCVIVSVLFVIESQLVFSFVVLSQSLIPVNLCC